MGRWSTVEGGFQQVLEARKQMGGGNYPRGAEEVKSSCLEKGCMDVKQTI